MSVNRTIYTISTLLTTIAALNWGAHAFGNNLVEKIENKKAQNVIYGLVVVAALLSLYYFIDLKCYSNSENYASNPQHQIPTGRPNSTPPPMPTKGMSKQEQMKRNAAASTAIHQARPKPSTPPPAVYGPSPLPRAMR